jgi:hypothetical protein
MNGGDMIDPETLEIFVTPFMAKLLKWHDGDIIETVLIPSTRIVRVKQPLPTMPELKIRRDDQVVNGH